jgi:DNA-binding NtrC family response regulator
MIDILIVDDDKDILPALTKLLKRDCLQIRTAESVHKAKEEIKKKIPDGLIVDLILADGSGLELIDILQNDATQIIIMTGFPTLDTAIVGLRSKAVDYLVKPIEMERLRNWLDGLCELTASPPILAQQGKDFSEMIGQAPSMERVYKMIEKVAPSNITVLLQGESGTGKEVAARAIHSLSNRSTLPMLALNCGAVNENLIGDDLFGHERGGFTGANKLHKGYFERADGSTLFLDEITEMPIDLQSHFLRVLETSKLVRIGGNTEIKTDVRLIAATNRDPHEAVTSNKMREDLFYRLAVFPIILPPLRERKPDIPLLVNFFLAQFNKSSGIEKTIEQQALRYLENLPWPGNIRQLRNAVQSAHLISASIIKEEDFQCYPQPNVHEKKPIDNHEITLELVEQRLITKTLEENKGNKKITAEVLGISLKTLYNKLKKYEELQS